MTDAPKLPLVDLTKHIAPALSRPPIVLSERSSWKGIFFNHYDHPAHESPEFQYLQHIIGIVGKGHPIRSEHRFGGQVQNCYCQPGEVLLIPARMSYASLWPQAGEFSLIGIFPTFFEQVVNESVRVRQIELLPAMGLADPFIQQVGIALKTDVDANYPAGRLFGESLATGLVIHLLKHYSAWQAILPSELTACLSESQLNTVKDYVRAHLDQDIALAEMAGLLNLSQYHFCRLFKQSTGFTPHRYLTRCRIKKAKHLLLSSKLTITEIALEVGFKNHSSFTRLFRRWVGVTPTLFREK